MLCLRAGNQRLANQFRQHALGVIGEHDHGSGRQSRQGTCEKALVVGARINERRLRIQAQHLLIASENAQLRSGGGVEDCRQQWLDARIRQRRFQVVLFQVAAAKAD
jgi:hypothetical protein